MVLQSPFEMTVDLESGQMSVFERHVTRYGRDMIGYYGTQDPDEDALVYEYFERNVPNDPGQIVQNVTVIYPGDANGEYFMTKGHYHANPRASEVYLCLNGEGFLVMQTKTGDWCACALSRGKTVYVPPGWAHRSVNVGDRPLVLYALYPADAGHDYDAISQGGFLKRIVRGLDGKPALVDSKRVKEETNKDRRGYSTAAK